MRASRRQAPWLVAFLLLGRPAAAQTPVGARLAILQAEDRRAVTPHDLAVIRGGVHSGDADVASTAVRALGRLERPALMADIMPSLKHPALEVRAEAANALGQAAAGWKLHPPAGALAPIVHALAARLDVESEADVRSAICQTLGRLPYTTGAEVSTVERTLLDDASRNPTVTDRLGVAAGFEALVRRQRKLQPPGAAAITALTDLSTLRPAEAASGARVRRLALEALITAGAADAAVVQRAVQDPDAQVRRLAMRAAGTPATEGASNDHDGSEMPPALKAGLADDSAMVRLEAVRGLPNTMGDHACAALVTAAKDRDTQVDLVALDQLAKCGSSADAVAALERTVDDLSQAGEPRGWHRAAHALVALATASRAKAQAALPQFAGSRVWQLRMYAARAAAILDDRAALEKFAADDDDNVCEAAIDGLVKAAGHRDDGVYVAALTRHGHQAQRAAALALAGTPAPDAAVPALKSALQRLEDEGFDNSHDARAAIAGTLEKLGAPVTPRKGHVPPPSADLNGDDLRRLASPRARVTIRGVGVFDLALFTNEAPATVLRFVHLAETGYYNGLTFHRIVPNFVIQGGSPGASEYIGDSWFMRDELGLWPHVRGAVGISTRGRDTGDAQIFIDTVDNPRLDHDYTVFAQVLNGIEIVDRILEGDVIERIDIIP
ncbi:MAG TPA: peptidylprolyl isomerase [Vicinamibacterales bacterium]|nr:peptidylprolyl isomerase [Vicinamibacterales bacterium]